MKRGSEIDRGTAQCGEQAEKKPGEDRNAKGEEQDAAIGFDDVELRQRFRTKSEEQVGVNP